MRPGISGFTLIELAIVVAIIGMIATAILLSGEGVFGRSGVASLLSNIKDLATASREFKARYGYFPGDLPDAATAITAGGGISAGCSYAAGGNVGNGLVDTPTESDCALEHLVKAGFLSKIAYDSSSSKFFIASTVGIGVRVSLWLNSTTNENAIRVKDLPCDAAIELDRKLDSATTDNKPFNQGAVTGRDSSNAVIEICSVGASNDPVAAVLVKY